MTMAKKKSASVQRGQVKLREKKLKDGSSSLYLDINVGGNAVIDRINKVNGTETIVLGSQQYTQKDGKGKANVFANAIKHDFKSKNPTTRWSDIIRLK